MRTPKTKRAIIVIEARAQTRTNNWFKANVDTVGGEDTFTVGLSASGNSPATHYWCNIALTAAEWASVDGVLPDAERQVFDSARENSRPGALDTPREVLRRLGLQEIE